MHGIPGERRVEAGDVVKLDLTADRGGYVADAARTVLVAPSSPDARRLAGATRSAFAAACRVARTGAPVRSIGREIEREASRHATRVLRELCSHGVGRRVHEPPTIPNFDDPSCRGTLTDGLVITVEPILTLGGFATRVERDGWTIATGDRAIAAHFEETVVITRGRPLVLTRPEPAAAKRLDSAHGDLFRGLPRRPATVPFRRHRGDDQGG